MDDTVILATSRDALEQKLALLHRETKAISMEIHPRKSQYMVINSNDSRAFILNHITIEHTKEYIYLGTPIIAASLQEQVRAHIELKRMHLMKFSSFLKKNADAPFPVKELVFKSAINSAVLYGCESWLCNDLKPAITPILSAQKQLLAVRNQTCGDLVQAELGYPGTVVMVKEAQIKFLQKLTSRDGYAGCPAHFAINLATQVGAKAGKYVNTLRGASGCFRTADLENLRSKISGSESSRRKTYYEFNFHLTSHRIYKENVPEHLRIAFTRMRLGSHRLRIETGRWTRTPVEERLCICGEIQTERHVLLHCPVSRPLRGQFPGLDFTNLGTLMDGTPVEVAKYCTTILRNFEGERTG